MTLYSFTHLIQPWLLPPGINILAIALGLLLMYRWPTIGKTLCIIGMISIWLLSTPIVAYHLIALLQDKYPMLQPSKLDQGQPHDAIVVLGGGDTIEAEYGNKRTVSDFTLHRLNYAAYLHKKNNLPIIVSGGRSIPSIDSQADLMANVLRDNYNIKVELKEDQSLTTADESKAIASLMKQHRLHHIYLVTNSWHMPRSIFAFQCAGVKVTPAPMGYFVYGPNYTLISYLPNIDALYASSIAIHEFIGLIWYNIYYENNCVDPSTVS